MKTNKGLLFLLFPLVTAGMTAQTDYELQIYNAYQASDLEKWNKILLTMENIRKITWRSQTDLLDAYYGYISKAIELGQRKKARITIEKALTLCGSLLGKYGEAGLLLAYRSALLACKADLGLSEIPALKQKSIADAKRALTLIPKNPLIHYIWANIGFHTPQISEKSRNATIESYETALTLMRANPEKWCRNWLYPNLLKTMLRVYVENGRSDKVEKIENLLNG